MYRFEDGTRTLGEQLDRWTSVEKSEGDGMVDWNRARYNQMDSDDEQRAYEAGLREKRYYYLNGMRVPKIVYDAVEEDFT